MDESEPDDGEIVESRARKDDKSVLANFAGGFCGGFVPTLLLHPFELVKIRLAAAAPAATLVGVKDKQQTTAAYRTLTSGIREIYSEGGLRAFYGGVSANVAGNALAWGSYLAVYGNCKKLLANQLGYRSQSELPSAYLFGLGITSGVVTLAVTNPIWVAKTRLCLQYGSVSSPHTYTGLVDCLRKTYRVEGIAGFYRGFTPGLLGTAHGAVQMTLYDRSKYLYTRYKNQPLDSQLSATEYILISAISKMLASTIMYPYQVIRIRLQDHNRKWKGVGDVIRTTWRTESVRGFYRGLVPNLLRVTPHTALTLTIYEYISHRF